MMAPSQVPVFERIRIEMQFDSGSRLFAAALYYPKQATQPIAQTAFIFNSEAAATRAIHELLKEAFIQVPDT